MAAAPDTPQPGPAPAPSGRSSGSRSPPASWLPVALLAVLALVVVVATTGVVVWALTSNDGDGGPGAGAPRSDSVPRPTFDEAASTTGPDAPSSEPSPTTTRSDPSTTVPPAGASSHPVIGPHGAFTMTVPAGWTGAAIGEDPAGAARASFPDDASKAALFQLLLETFVAGPDEAGALPGTQFAVIDGDGLGTEPVAEMAIVTGDAIPGIDLPTAESVMRDNALAGGGELVDSGRLDTALGTWAWQETTPGEDVGVADLHLVEYVIVLGEQVWHITFWSDELPSERATADAIVESFMPR
ncbi:MAG TPA: hypothetical protein VK306_00345 [Acidimicrobiales bacterium]|nr:hypothetical protein [Acidimicrobiales bacterium]